MKSTTGVRSGVSASAVIEMSTWFEASTGILVSCETRTGSSFTFRRLAYSFREVPCRARPMLAAAGGVLNQPRRVCEHGDAQHPGLLDRVDARALARRG